MQILKNKNSNRFCGPAALALLTGIHVDDAARTLRVVSGKRAIKGVHNHHMVAALAALGHMALPVPAGGKPTLTQALRGALKVRNQRYLVIVTGHYVVIEGRMLWDNEHPQGIRLTECPYRRKRVRGIWAVIRHAEVAPPRDPAKEFRSFSRAVESLGLAVAGGMIDAPTGRIFGSGLHSISIDECDLEGTLARVKGELPLEPCPPDCDCQE